MRRSLGIGRTSSTDRRANEFERMSDAELVEALSRQANELGQSGSGLHRPGVLRS
jgi:hypothetical protein